MIIDIARRSGGFGVFKDPPPTKEELLKKYGEVAYNSAIELIEIDREKRKKKGIKSIPNNYYVDYVCGQIK